MVIKRVLLFGALIVPILAALGQSYGQWGQKFEQLGTKLPTPNTYRTARGLLERIIGSNALIIKLR